MPDIEARLIKGLHMTPLRRLERCSPEHGEGAADGNAQEVLRARDLATLKPCAESDLAPHGPTRSEMVTESQ
jgi:hypothetical protein